MNLSKQLYTFFILLIMLVFLNNAYAQTKGSGINKPDTVLYYLNSEGRAVNTKDSAAYFLLILPPDTSTDKQLFRVKEYYKNGKIRMIGNSSTNNLNLKYQGPQVTYFLNGHKLRIANYANGALAGDEVQYYPNGKFYCSKTYVKDKPPFFDEYKDSTGKVMATDGNGLWKEYMDEDFKNNFIEGEVALGFKEGKWEGVLYDSMKVILQYRDGEVISSNTNGISGDRVPEFPGGLNAFANYIGHSLRYPDKARTNGTQGKVIVCFVVERDGSLSNFKVIRGVGDGIDEEAVRVLQLCPKWFPEYKMVNLPGFNIQYQFPFL